MANHLDTCCNRFCTGCKPDPNADEVKSAMEQVGQWQNEYIKIAETRDRLAAERDQLKELNTKLNTEVQHLQRRMLRYHTALEEALNSEPDNVLRKDWHADAVSLIHPSVLDCSTTEPQ